VSSPAGDLRDLDLASLIQIICLSGQTVAVELVRRGESGRIFFERGNVVHAVLAPLYGEAALLRLLSWSDGSFQTLPNLATPSHSMSVSWQFLSQEGFRIAAERSANFNQEPETAVAASGGENDGALELELLGLLSDCETVLTRLADKRVTKRPALALEALAEIVNRILKYSQTQMLADFSGVSLTAALEQALVHYPQASGLAIQRSLLVAETAIERVEGRASGLLDRNLIFQQTCYVVIEVIGILFQHFAFGFRAADARERWRETYSVFLLDLTRGIDRLSV
jgi:hypothetical protein